MAPKGLGEVVFDLVVLVDTRLRAVVGAAQGEVAAYGKRRDGGARCILRRDLEACGGGLHNLLREAGLEVETRPVSAEVVDRAGGELADVVAAVMLGEGEAGNAQA